MLDFSGLFSTENLPSLQNGSSFPGDLLYSIYGDAYFSSHRIVWVRVILILLYALFAVIGVTTNAAVVFFLLIWHPKSLHNITNRFVLALAISDIFMSGFNMPMQAYYEMQERVYFSNLACQLVFSTFGLPMHISCLVILVIGIDRYNIIVYPLRRRMPRGSASLTLVAIAVISVISVIPIAIFNKSSQAVTRLEDGQREPMEYHYCVEEWPSPEIRLCYTIFTFTVQFFLPLLLTATLYTRIYFRLHERRFRKRDLERKKRTNKILIAIVICFFICWTPWNVFSIILEVYAYRAQKRNPINLFPLFEGTQSNLSSVVNIKSLLLPSRDNNLVFIHEDLNASVRPPRSFERKYNISDIVPQSRLLLGGHAKIIDLILKLLAMCSGCLNPCLYGCMTDTMRLLMKRVTIRFQRTRNLSLTRLRGSLRGFPDIPTSDRSSIKTRAFHKYRRNAFGTPVYKIHCCGFQFIFRTGFHQHNEQVKNLFDTKRKSDVSEPRISSLSKRTRRLQRCSTNDKTPPYPSGEKEGYGGDQKFPEYQTGQNQLGIQQVNHSLQHLDPASLTFLTRESATLSINESSTKRTSLLPSSFYEKTPRSSFMVDAVKQQESGSANSRTDQSLLRVSSPAPVVTVCEPSSTFNEELPCADEETTRSLKNSPVHHVQNNRHQKLVNIEVHTPPPSLTTSAPPIDIFRRRSSSKGVPKSCRTLAPLEEVSNCGDIVESATMQEHKPVQRQEGKVVPALPTTAAALQRDRFKRSVSISCDNESSRGSSSANNRQSLQMRRQSTYEVFRLKKSPTTSTVGKNSSLVLREGSTESESMISDDFAHFHKIVLQDERMKVNLAPKKPRKSHSINNTLGMSVKSQPRKPSLYSARLNRSWPSKPVNNDNNGRVGT
ncbi:Neuropeptide Y receptor [Echinococcus granulosus]|uniref:Neuropeptide Y receptor n=1 Tax=Echinococcus granulosus TaxID=6210 RepID=U6JBI8_ECHGR|nr:Neuropeptide Y receptor [Echinococcus granulosus]EUB60288.1 Neuropeptide Y receptor [Echinococcus granulosus]CDS21450.1 neuropeptide receptor [Echinococcus granulosus]